MVTDTNRRQQGSMYVLMQFQGVKEITLTTVYSPRNRKLPHLISRPSPWNRQWLHQNRSPLFPFNTKRVYGSANYPTHSISMSYILSPHQCHPYDISSTEAVPGVLMCKIYPRNDAHRSLPTVFGGAWHRENWPIVFRVVVLYLW